MIHCHWETQGYPKLSEFSPHLKNLEEHNFGDGNLPYKALTLFSGTDLHSVPLGTNQQRSAQRYWEQ
jgi:hypothetical protein